MDYCLLSQGFSVFITFVFVVSFIILVYYFIEDSMDDQSNDRPQEQTNWMIFFLIIITICLFFSGWCVTDSFRPSNDPFSTTIPKKPPTKAKKPMKKSTDPFFDTPIQAGNNRFFGQTMNDNSGFIFG